MTNASLNSRVSFQPVVTELSATLSAVRALFCLNGFLYATWATRIPSIKSQFQLSNGTLGMALMIVAAGAMVALPFAGWLCSRFGSRRIVGISLGLYLMSLPMVTWMPGLASLFAVLFAFGFGHGMLDVSMNVQALEVERRLTQSVNSSIHALWSLGGLAGALTGSLFATSEANVRWHFGLVAVALSTAVIPILFRLLQDTNVSTSDSREQNGTKSLANRSRELYSESRNQPHGPPSLGRSSRGVLILLGIISFCVMAGEGAMADWSAVLLYQSLEVSEGTASIGYAVFAISMAMGRFAGDGLTARWGAVKQIRLSALLAFVGVLVVVTSMHIAVAIVGFMLIGAGLATIVPVVFSLSGRLPGTSPGAAIATVSTIGYFGFLIGPPLIGFASEWVSLRIALSSLAGTMMLTMMLAGIAGQSVHGSTLATVGLRSCKPTSKTRHDMASQ